MWLGEVGALGTCKQEHVWTSFVSGRVLHKGGNNKSTEGARITSWLYFLRISAIISVRTMSFDFHLFFPLGHSYLLFSPFGNVLKKHLFEN